MKKLKVCLIMLCFLLSACNSVEIYSALSESQANLMLSTLLKRGIEADKLNLGKTGFAITVNKEQMVQALEILKENSLPQEEYQSLGTVFSGDSMIASANEEKSRLAYAISQELSNTFSQIDGVLNTRVHIVLNEIDTVTNKITEASASVFVRHTPDSSVVNYVPKIKELTAGAVADLTPEQVSVMLVPARDDVTVPPAAQSSGFDFSLLGIIIAIAILLNILMFPLRKFLKKSEAFQSFRQKLNK